VRNPLQNIVYQCVARDVKPEGGAAQGAENSIVLPITGGSRNLIGPGPCLPGIEVMRSRAPSFVTVCISHVSSPGTTVKPLRLNAAAA
jgi:hypothetical protein